jgi:hypothetical protein
MLVLVLSLLSIQVICGGDLAKAVFRVDSPYPTKDKPQSKIWYAEGHWWAWLPDREGSGIWKRTASGWQRDMAFDTELRLLSGHADVWSDAEGVFAVLVSKNQLTVAHLKYDSQKARYRLAAKPKIWTHEPGGSTPKPIETATIGRDATGRVWIAYDFNARMFVRSTSDILRGPWTEPTEIGSGAIDDISCLVVLPDSVGVIWSDQKTDTVWFRRHLNSSDPGKWAKVEIVEQAHKSADDHFNAAVSHDGVLYVATKNSIDEIGQPQLVLRIRMLDGTWLNRPYAHRTSTTEPSRPIAVIGGKPERLLLAHTVYQRGMNKEQFSQIAGLLVDPTTIKLDQLPRLLIQASAKLNDVTSTKSVVPADKTIPWIILASDEKGNVYEAVIQK